MESESKFRQVCQWLSLILNHKTISIAEIKSAETINSSFWKTLYYFENLFGNPLEKLLYYGGKENQKRSGKLHITGWQNIIE